MRRPSPTSAKRWAFKIALCLLAGTVVTWGVAWGCALVSPIGQSWMIRGLSTEELARELGTGPAAEGRQREANRDEGIGFGITVRSAGLIEAESFYERPARAVTYLGELRTTAAGWPWRAFECRRNPRFPNRVEGGIRIPTPIARREPFITPRQAALPVDLPFAPQPRGFALNTLFYAAVLLGVVECVAFARRRVRRGRGRCPSCGYDRAGLAEGAACPECGGGARP